MKNINFGLIGPGNIARKFASACSLCEGVTLKAVASGNLAKAEAFAEKYGIEKAYGSHEELIKDKSIEAVYISVINKFHYPLIKQCLENGKAVICEKPFVLNPEEALEIIKLQKKTGLLCMEGMWSNFLPTYIKAKEWIDENKIGKVKNIFSSFCFSTETNPDSRIYNKELGGGATYDLGIYCISFSTMMAGAEVSEIKAHTDVGSTGVDEVSIATIKFENGIIADCTCGIKTMMPSDGYVCGEKGYIHFYNFWTCRKCELYNNKHELVDVCEDEAENGFIYEINHFADLLNNGKTQSDVMPLERTLMHSKIIEEIIK